MIGSRWPLGGHARRFARWSAIAIALGAAAAPAALKQDAARGPRPATAGALSAADDAFLEDLSRRSFAFFWEQTDPATGHHPRPIAHRRIAVERQPRQGRQHRLGRLRPDRDVHRRRARLAAARGDPRAHAHDAAHLRRTAGARARLVLSLGQPPHRRARVAERGVVDRHGAADGRRAQRAPVLRRRSRDRAAGHGDLPPPRFRLDAQRPPDAALARLAARERDDRAPLGRLQRSVDALPARPRIADASAAGGLVARLGPPDADLGRLDLRHPRRAALPAPVLARVGRLPRLARSRSAARLVRQQRRRDAGQPRLLPVDPRSVPGLRPRTCGASRRPTRATATRRGAARRPIRRSTAPSCPAPRRAR